MTTDSGVHFSGDSVERGLRFVGLATVVVTTFTLLLAVIAIPLILSTASDAEQANSTSSVTACRSEARAIVDDAISGALTRNSELLGTISRLTEAGASRNAAAVESLSVEAEANRQALAAATAELTAATQTYNEAIRLSIEAPDEFVKTCDG